MSETQRDYKHGQLARSCRICELERELAAVTAERDALRGACITVACWLDEGFYSLEPHHVWVDKADGIRNSLQEAMRKG